MRSSCTRSCRARVNNACSRTQGWGYERGAAGQRSAHPQLLCGELHLRNNRHGGLHTLRLLLLCRLHRCLARRRCAHALQVSGGPQQQGPYAPVAGSRTPLQTLELVRPATAEAACPTAPYMAPSHVRLRQVQTEASRSAPGSGAGAQYMGESCASRPSARSRLR